MDFQVLPAIDVAGEKLARYTPAGVVPVEAFGGDPAAAAAAFVGAGATWLHVVDLDLALDLPGVRNIDVVTDLHSRFPSTRIQVSGGLAERRDLKDYLDVGAARVVLGSAALASRDATERLVEELGDRLVVGVEIESGRIRARGASDVDLPLEETLGWLRRIAPARLLVTAVERVGELTGPDLRSLARIVPELGCPVIAAGGVATEGQVRDLAELGVEAVVLGTLLYEQPEMAGVLLRLAEVLRR